MGWREVGEDSFHAAQGIKHHPRSCVSRAYYAAYALMSSELVSTRGVKFVLGRDGPSHFLLPTLVENHLRNRMNISKIRGIKAALRRLYNIRLNADYRPNLQISSSDVRDALADAAFILAALHRE